MLPEVPTRAPKRNANLSKKIGVFLLKVLGWKIKGDFPDESKVVIAIGPHTSNWDFIIAATGILATGLRISYLMKKEAFFWPFGRFFRWLGGVPVDRRAAENTVDQIVAEYNRHEAFWVAITPEGTRKQVKQYKTGFLRVAKAAGVPVLIIAWNYPAKELIIDKLWPLSSNLEQDAADIRSYINSHYKGRYPDRQ